MMVKKKKIKESQKHPLIIFFVFRPILGFTNPTPLKNNLVPEITKGYREIGLKSMI
jgi:hypothetical protein